MTPAAKRAAQQVSTGNQQRHQNAAAQLAGGEKIIGGRLKRK